MKVMTKKGLQAAVRAMSGQADTRANALDKLPKVGSEVTIKGEVYVVTNVKPFTDRGRERHEVTLKKPEGSAVFHANIDGAGTWSNLRPAGMVTAVLKAGIAGYLYRDPVDEDELRSLIIRMVIANGEDDDERKVREASRYLLGAYSSLFGEAGFVNGEAAEKFIQKEYEKHGGAEASYMWPETLEWESSGGWPKWLLAAVAEVEAEKDVAVRRHFQQMAVKGEKP